MPPPSSPPGFYALGVVLLAAGRSSRMGRPKLLLPWGNTTILGHLLAQWRALGAVQIAVVCAAGDTAIAAELDRLGFPGDERVINPDPERGMFSSIQCAAQWPGWRGRLAHRAIVLGDQPHMSADTLRVLIAFSTAHPDTVCQPVQGGHRRHPVFLPPSAFEQLACARATTLKGFLGGFLAPTFCTIEDPGLALDLDRPEDYEEAKRRYWPG